MKSSSGKRMTARKSRRPSASGYNESELARAVGVSPSTVHRVLAGERKPPCGRRGRAPA